MVIDGEICYDIFKFNIDRLVLIEFGWKFQLFMGIGGKVLIKDLKF